MSASKNSQILTSGEQQRHPHEPYLLSPGGQVLLIVIVIIGSFILFVMVAVLYYATKRRMYKFRQPGDNGHELLERRQAIDCPRKSDGSTGTRYESENPVENNADSEV